MEPDLPEGDIDGKPNAGGRVAATVVPLRDELAEVRVLEWRRRDPAQLHPPDELVAGLEEDSEVGEILRLAEPREPALLGLQREERVRPDRLPAIEEDPVAHKHLEQSLGVVDLQLA